jgi:hypothetical protein
MKAVNRLAQHLEWLQDIEPITAKGTVDQVTLQRHLYLT